MFIDIAAEDKLKGLKTHFTGVKVDHMVDHQKMTWTQAQPLFQKFDDLERRIAMLEVSMQIHFVENSPS